MKNIFFDIASVKKEKISAIILISIGFIMLFCSQSVYADTTNLEKVMEKYGVTPNEVLEVRSAEALDDMLERSAELYRSSGKVIVHLASGEYVLDDYVTVPEDTVLVAEKDTFVSPSEKFTYLVRVSGSMYGGNYDSNYKNQTTIKLLPNRFSNNNGLLENLNVTRSNYYGIVAQGSGNAKVDRCKVTKCKASGISVLKASAAGDTNIASITNSNISNNGTAGINLSFADVGTIRNCIINGNGDKAVSTNSDSSTGCHIKVIADCTIKNNKTNGVHIKPNCRLDHFVNNTLVGNDDGLVAAAITKEKTKGKSIIKDIRGNTFKKSVTQQIEAQGKGASITIGKGNVIVSGKNYGILAMNYGKVQISGSNNIIKSNYKGLGAQSNGIINVTGKKNQIIKNTAYGVHAATKGKVSITGTKCKISGSGKSAVYCSDRAKVYIYKKNNVISGKMYKTNQGKIITRSVR